jgi:hypothetical protein
MAQQLSEDVFVAPPPSQYYVNPLEGAGKVVEVLKKSGTLDTLRGKVRQLQQALDTALAKQLCGPNRNTKHCSWGTTCTRCNCMLCCCATAATTGHQSGHSYSSPFGDSITSLCLATCFVVKLPISLFVQTLHCCRAGLGCHEAERE